MPSLSHADRAAHTHARGWLGEWRAARGDMAAYRSAWRKACRGEVPRDDLEVAAWCLRQLVLLWDRPTGVEPTLGDFLGGSSEAAPFRVFLKWTARPALFLGFAFWPEVSWVLCRSLPERERGRSWRVCLRRPDLRLAGGRGPFCEADAEDVLTCLWHIVAGAYQYNHHFSPAFTMDDKGIFARMCREAGLSHVPVLDPAGPDLPEECIIKPRLGTQGRGVRRVGRREASVADVRTEVVQPRLVNHPDLQRVAGPDAGLCTLRINTLKTPAGDRVLLGCIARLARAGSVADNFHAGGIAAPVDRATGCLQAGTEDLLKQADWGQRNAIHAHPDTGVRFAGCLVYPQFPEACALALRAHESLGPELLMCSWDIVPGPEGPLLLEAASCMGGVLELLHRPDAALYRRALLHHIGSMLEP
jgi:hypothetical protein